MVVIMNQIGRFVQGISFSSTLSIISLFLFILIFIGAVIWVLSLKKGYRSGMKNLPLNDNFNEKIE